MRACNMAGLIPILCDIHGLWVVAEMIEGNPRLLVFLAPIEAAFKAVRLTIFPDTFKEAVSLFNEYACGACAAAACLGV
jgi:hypothetical protein